MITAAPPTRYGAMGGGRACGRLRSPQSYTTIRDVTKVAKWCGHAERQTLRATVERRMRISPQIYYAYSGGRGGIRTHEGA